MNSNSSITLGDGNNMLSVEDKIQNKPTVTDGGGSSLLEDNGADMFSSFILGGGDDYRRNQFTNLHEHFANGTHTKLHKKASDYSYTSDFLINQENSDLTQRVSLLWY